MNCTAFLCSLLLLTSNIASADCIGGIAFEAPARYPVSADQVVLVHDLNGDGTPDIITSGTHVVAYNAFSLLLNRGDGTFGAERLVASSSGERLEDVGELNGDGNLDLVASNYFANGIVVYRGVGPLQFDGGTAYGTATHGGPSRILDYDRDGVADLVSLSFGSGNPVRVHLFRGDGHGGLSAKTTLDTDLANGDSESSRIVNGTLEILVAEHSGHLGLLRFVNGGVSISRTSAGPGLDRASVFADLNGDGVADIVDAVDDSSPTEPIFVTLANGDGTFRERTRLQDPRQVAFPTAVQVADLDGDGRADLIVSDFRADRLLFFRGGGTGNFGSASPIFTGGAANDFKIADVNGDGRPDLLTVNNDHTMSVVINRGPCETRRRSVRH